ncbi:MAG: cysteine--tRNA ligase [Candidatus Paceibacterota bacterium]
MPVWYHWAMLTVYNSLTGTTEEFTPLDPPRVTMYNCGPTVYQYVHIGNLRSFVFADILRCALEHSGYEVDQVMNITDVGHLTGDTNDTGDDKVEAQARKEGKTAEEITQYYTDAFLSDLAQLNIDRNRIRFPRATEHIDQQIGLIRQLEEKGVTYTIDDGVYFDTSSAEQYPKLGTIQTSGLQAGARVEENTQKKHPADFALWKFSKGGEKRLQEWDSPWGRGFPGWHLECSAMAMQYLGPTIDIHTGGVDLAFPHHANEIAQSECATDKPFARYWLHSEHLSLKGAKMSKSDGNIVTLQSLVEEGLDPLAYRYWLLTAHYRSPISFDAETVRGSQRALVRLKAQLEALPAGGMPNSEYVSKATAALNDDLDTPAMIALLWETVKDESLGESERRTTAEHILELLGIDLSSIADRKPLTPEEVPSDIANLVRERETARLAKNFEEADTLREEITSAGYEIHDTDTGPTLTRI